MYMGILVEWVCSLEVKMLMKMPGSHNRIPKFDALLTLKSTIPG